MLLQLQTGRVNGCNGGQEPLIYIVSTLEKEANENIRFLFSDGHGIAAFTSWFDDIKNLNEVDREVVYADYWMDTKDDPDRQRRKQA